MMNSPKEVLLGEEARARLKQGVDIVGDAVGTTIGPRGKNVVIERKYGSPTITNDGYTVANNIDDLSDPFVNAGVLLAYQAAKKTNSTAGDGTSTATILTQHIYAEAHKIIASGVNAMVLRKGMEKAAAAVAEAIVASSRQVAGLEVEILALTPYDGFGSNFLDSGFTWLRSRNECSSNDLDAGSLTRLLCVVDDTPNEALASGRWRGALGQCSRAAQRGFKVRDWAVAYAT